MFSARSTVVLLASIALLGITDRVAAQHTGDVVLGIDSNGQIAISPDFFLPEENFFSLPPGGGLFPGWADSNPGFDTLVNPDPAQGIFPLEPGADIWLEVVQFDPAFQIVVLGNPPVALHEPGDQTRLGDHTLHEHIPFHINIDDPAFDPDQCVWEATIILRDEGITGYLESEPLTYSFTNVAVRPAGTPADGDFDESGFADVSDMGALALCTAGPKLMPNPDDPGVTTCVVECLNTFDFDDDRNVDLADLAAFQIESSN